MTTLGGIAARDVAVDNAGNVFFPEQNTGQIFRIDSSGEISAVAGNGTLGFSGDGGPASSAEIGILISIAVDASGNLYFNDFFNNCIRKVTPSGIINTFVNGNFGRAVKVDGQGNLYAVAGTLLNKITPDGTVTVIAGNGQFGYAGDGGFATSAALEGAFVGDTVVEPKVSVDRSGNIFIPDTSNNVIREILASAPSVDISTLQLDLSGQSGGAPTAAQNISITSRIGGLAFLATVPNGVNWLTLNPSSGVSPCLIQVMADPSNLAPGLYQTKIFVATPNANPQGFEVSVSLVVNPGQPPSLLIDKSSLSFPFSRHGSARSQAILVSNSGGGKLSFTATTTTASGGAWLSVLPASGQASPANPATLTATADPAGLLPGTYTGQVAVITSSQRQNIPVTMTISALDKAILLSQSGLSFLGVSQGGVLPSQSFGVLNIGTGVLNWKVSTSTLPPGGTWLSVTQTSGSTDAAADTVPTVQVSVDAASLPAGKYYGLVRVDAPGAANTPQVVTVVVSVLAPGADVGAVIQPADLLFTATAGAESPGSQNVFAYNVVAASKSFHASLATGPGLNITILPTDAMLDPQQPTRVVVQPFTSGLAAGVYTGVITLQFSDGRVLSANVHVIVSAAGPSSSSNTLEQSHEARKFDTSAACTPTKLVLASNTLAQSFAVPAGYPVGLEVNVKDDCGMALTSGSVTASFSNSDPELQLQSLKNGLWNATWQTNNGSESSVAITLQANDLQGKLKGKSVVNTSLSATSDQPLFPLQGVVSAAGGQPFVPVAPGSIISLYGTNLAGNAVKATSEPLPIQILDTTVFMGGLVLPLYYVSDTQVNAQVPFEIDPNATYQLLVTRGNTISLPVGVDVAPAQPAVFRDTSVAPNQGVILVVRGKEQFEATPSSPASEGDVIVMFCAGLGAVNPVIAAGAQGNGQPTTITPTVTIGGINTTVKFSGLTPGFVGLYQINAIVPKGVPSGNTVPVTINIAGQTSPPVIMAIQ